MRSVPCMVMASFRGLLLGSRFAGFVGSNELVCFHVFALAHANDM